MRAVRALRTRVPSDAGLRPRPGRSLLSVVLPLAALALSLVAGCNHEEQVCDDDGCYVCDGIGCREVQPPTRSECRGDFECAEGSLCTDLGCATSCNEDADCPDGTACRDMGDGLALCVGPGEPDPEPEPGTCERNADCGDDELVCRDGLCTPDDRSCGESGCSCVETGMCAEDFVCSDGECRPEEDTCQFNHECGGGGRTCVDGRCVDPCTGDADCATGQRCEEGLCQDVPPETGECVANEDCGDAGVCIDSTCHDGCAADDDCGDGRYCRDGLCEVDDRPDPFCTADSECAPGHPCIGGACRTPCESSAQCLRFDVQFSFCLDGFCATTNEATSDCVTSSDCDDGRECIDGICR